MHLRNPSPDLAEYSRRDSFRPDLRIQRRLATPNVRLRGLDKRRAFEDAPEHVEGNVDGDSDVGGNEVADGPVAAREDGESVEEDDDDEVGERRVRRVWLPWAAEDHAVPVDALCDQRLAELDVGDQDADPGEEVGDGGQVLEPVEDVVCAGGDTHVGEQRDGGRDCDTPVWNAALGASEQELGCLLVLSQGEQVTGSGVEESVGGGGGGCQNDGVDDGGKDGDTSTVDGNDPGGVGGASTTVKKVRSVGGDTDTNGEGAEDVEEEDTPEDTADGLGDVLSWVLGFTGSDGDHLDTSVGESGVDQSREETEEAASVAYANILLHGTRVLPVAESKAVMAWCTTEVDNESKNEQTDNGDDLDTGKDEFGFTID